MTRFEPYWTQDERGSPRLGFRVVAPDGRTTTVELRVHPNGAENGKVELYRDDGHLTAICTVPDGDD